MNFKETPLLGETPLFGRRHCLGDAIVWERRHYCERRHRLGETPLGETRLGETSLFRRDAIVWKTQGRRYYE